MPPLSGAPDTGWEPEGRLLPDSECNLLGTFTSGPHSEYQNQMSQTQVWKDP